MKEKVLKVYDFFADDTPYYAASLSFFTIFSILPLIALLISLVSQLPHFSNYLGVMMTHIMDFINPTHSESLSSTLKGFLENTNQLGKIGIFYLLFVFTMFFRDYEYVVNKIYDTPTRPIYAMFFLYLIFLFSIPFLVGVFVFVSTLPLLSEIPYYLKLLTFLFVWFIFAMLFFVSGNKKKSFKSIAIASLITFIGLSLTKNLFGLYVSSNTTYATIYGSFSVALFFFLYIYFSWNVYLYGMKLCATINNYGQSNESK